MDVRETLEHARHVADELTDAAMAAGKQLQRLPGDYAVFPFDGMGGENGLPLLCKASDLPRGPADEEAFPRGLYPAYPLNFLGAQHPNPNARGLPGVLEAEELLRWEPEIRAALA
jgi:hypothetical protein